MTIEAYPLHWPAGWKRTPVDRRHRSPFGTKNSRGAFTTLSVAQALGRLNRELDLLYAENIVISTNVRTRPDGLPYSTEKEPLDGGVAVYFNFIGEPTVLACDKWDRLADNIAALAKHIEAMRGMDRWGVGSLAQAFAGYAALPAPGQAYKRPWYVVLNVDAGATPEEIKKAFTALAKRHHPDVGGDAATFAEITAAKEEGLRK